MQRALPTLTRHPELVSGSMGVCAFTCVHGGARAPWILKQVQDDECLAGEGGAMRAGAAPLPPRCARVDLSPAGRGEGRAYLAPPGRGRETPQAARERGGAC